MNEEASLSCRCGRLFYQAYALHNHQRSCKTIEKGFIDAQKSARERLKRKRDEKVAQRSVLRHAPKDSNVGSPPKPAIILVEFHTLFNFLHDYNVSCRTHLTKSPRTIFIYLWQNEGLGDLVYSQSGLEISFLNHCQRYHLRLPRTFPLHARKIRHSPNPTVPLTPFYFIYVVSFGAHEISLGFPGRTRVWSPPSTTPRRKYRYPIYLKRAPKYPISILSPTKARFS
jgi:hypothetical protein